MILSHIELCILALYVIYPLLPPWHKCRVTFCPGLRTTPWISFFFFFFFFVSHNNHFTVPFHIKGLTQTQNPKNKLCMYQALYYSNLPLLTFRQNLFPPMNFEPQSIHHIIDFLSFRMLFSHLTVYIQGFLFLVLTEILILAKNIDILLAKVCCALYIMHCGDSDRADLTWIFHEDVFLSYLDARSGTIAFCYLFLYISWISRNSMHMLVYFRHESFQVFTWFQADHVTHLFLDDHLFYMHSVHFDWIFFHIWCSLGHGR